MSVATALGALVAHRRLVYVGGLLVIVAARLTPIRAAVPVSQGTWASVRVGVVALALSVMVATYVGERVARGDAQEDEQTFGTIRTLPLVFGLAGITIGLLAVLAGRAVGFLFVAGGLAFVALSTTGGERS